MKVELLAPAKNLEVGLAAIEAGADAVYIGGPSFGARKAAGNSLEDIATLARRAHFFRAQVLVTLNTLLRDEAEMQEAMRLAYAYKEIGVDAIIIQDLRLAEILFASGDFPRYASSSAATSSLPHTTYLHASTQCDNRTLERVQQLEAMGFKRVVLARELSYEEIRHIRENTTCELEAFVHGALCVSYSGACYLSEAVCGRSANRGECAQMCRLPYDVLDENKQEILHQKHILSLKDLDRSKHLKELIETGVSTLKIEGRLKDVDYVRNVVAYYRMLLDQLFAASAGICRRNFTPNPEKTFHRGATEYFAYERPAQLVNQDTPKSTGELLGYAPVRPEWGIHNGDGITFAGEGFYWPNSRIRIPAGTPVYRNYDAEFQKQLMAPNACTRTLPVDILFEETAEGFALTISESPSPAAPATSPLRGIEGVLPFTIYHLQLKSDKTPAQNAERAEAVVKQQLSKLGGTLLEAACVTVRWSQPYFLQASVLNDLRRQAVEGFMKQRMEKFAQGGQTLLCKNASDSPSTTPDQAPSTGKNRTALLSQSPLPLTTYHFPLSQSRTALLSKNALQLTTYNLQLPQDLMTCKYCILHELGCCKKKAPRKSGIPTYLRGQNGLLLRIQTDCANCQMIIIKA